MVLGGRWRRLALKPELVAEAAQSADPVARLPVTLLARNIIEPVFGVTDPRRDKRIDFVGGGRGLGELERLVSSGAAAIAFALYPTQMTDLMAVADAGAIMPPKSTWFEPKLADGMVSHCWIDLRSDSSPRIALDASLRAKRTTPDFGERRRLRPAIASLSLAMPTPHLHLARQALQAGRFMRASTAWRRQR